jgi:hypothetical protein
MSDLVIYKIFCYFSLKSSSDLQRQSDEIYAGLRRVGPHIGAGSFGKFEFFTSQSTMMFLNQF